MANAAKNEFIEAISSAHDMGWTLNPRALPLFDFSCSPYTDKCWLNSGRITARAEGESSLHVSTAISLKGVLFQFAIAATSVSPATATATAATTPVSTPSASAGGSAPQATTTPCTSTIRFYAICPGLLISIQPSPKAPPRYPPLVLHLRRRRRRSRFSAMVLQ